MMKLNTSREFAAALCEHFSLPKEQVLRNLKVNAEENEALSVSLTIMLTADDLAGIADHMPGRTGAPAATDLGKPVIPQPEMEKRR